jgi:hypothetical protein
MICSPCRKSRGRSMWRGLPLPQIGEGHPSSGTPVASALFGFDSRPCAGMENARGDSLPPRKETNG